MGEWARWQWHWESVRRSRRCRWPSLIRRVRLDRPRMGRRRHRRSRQDHQRLLLGRAARHVQAHIMAPQLPPPPTAVPVFGVRVPPVRRAPHRSRRPVVTNHPQPGFRVRRRASGCAILGLRRWCPGSRARPPSTPVQSSFRPRIRRCRRPIMLWQLTIQPPGIRRFRLRWWRRLR